MSQRIRKRRFRLNYQRFQAVSGHAWYAFVLAGTGAIAFSSKELTLQTGIVGRMLIAAGFILFAVAITDYLGR